MKSLVLVGKNFPSRNCPMKNLLLIAAVLGLAGMVDMNVAPRS